MDVRPVRYVDICGAADLDRRKGKCIDNIIQGSLLRTNDHFSCYTGFYARLGMSALRGHCHIKIKFHLCKEINMSA